MELIGVSKKKALKEIEKVFAKRGLVDVEVNGSITKTEIIEYLSGKGYDFTFQSRPFSISFLAVDAFPIMYVETK